MKGIKDFKPSTLQNKLLRFIANNSSIAAQGSNLSLYERVKKGWLIPNNSVLIPRLKSEFNIELDNNELYKILDELSARKLLNIEVGYADGEETEKDGSKTLIANDFDTKFFSITTEGYIYQEVEESERGKKVREKILFTISILAFVISLISLGIAITNCRRQEKEKYTLEHPYKDSTQTFPQKNH